MAFLFLSRRTGQWRLPLALDVWKLAPLMPFALSNLASHVLTVCSWMLLPMVVMALSEAQAAGFFYVAWAVARLAMVMTQQLALSLFAEGSHDLQGFQHRARGAMLVGLALGGLFALVVYFVGDVVLLLFGREYVEQSSSVLKVLATATPLAAITNNYLGVQRVRERIIPLLAVSAVVTACMLGGTAAFVPRFGIVGAGYGVVLGYGAGALLSLMLLYTSIKRSRKSMEPSEIRAA